MRLASRKGLIVAYIEGCFVVGLLLSVAIYKQLDLNFYDFVVPSLFYPIFWIALDALTGRLTRAYYLTSVAFAVASMGSWPVFFMSSFILSIFSFFILWFCFHKINEHIKN